MLAPSADQHGPNVLGESFVTILTLLPSRIRNEHFKRVLGAAYIEIFADECNHGDQKGRCAMNSAPQLQPWTAHRDAPTNGSYEASVRFSLRGVVSCAPLFQNSATRVSLLLSTEHKT